MRVYRLSASSVPGSLNVMRCTVKPAAFKVPSRNLSAPPSSGVTERQRNRSRAMASGSAVICSPPSIPQQLVDAGLGTRALVHALDDDGAVETRSAAPARQRAGHHDGIGRHLALRHISGFAIDDPGRDTEINAHG